MTLLNFFDVLFEEIYLEQEKPLFSLLTREKKEAGISADEAIFFFVISDKSSECKNQYVHKQR